ncbi:unnamed protein product [Alopecurus aequalis]
MTQQRKPGNELAELLWDSGPALRRTQFPAPPFPPFACSAAGREQELAKHHPAMRDLLAAPDDDDDAVPWLQHYPDIGVDDDDDGDRDTAPLPPEYCSALLSGYPGLPTAVASRDDAGGSASGSTVVVPPTVPPKQQQPRPSGEGIMNFSFFSRPLQRPSPPPPSAAASTSVGVESTVAQTNRLWSTPLFSEQRMAWLQPQPKESRAAAPSAPPPAPLAPVPPVPVRQQESAAALPQRLQPESRAPERPPPLPPATATTSSVCSDNGERSQLKRSSGSHQAPEWSLSQDDEDLDIDDEAGGARRSAARSTKRGRTAEVHNMSERRRRDRINEKMRALQELIPNCNKIDKASMLEEAIEYLKTLQLQVQLMSTMGCVPPMLAMQHMQMPPMAAAAHFHHHHLGAMGYGMGAFDPRLVAAAAQFPYPMMPGMPMYGHAMPSPPPPFPQQQAAAGAMAGPVANGIVVDNDGAAHADQQTPGDHPQVPRPM